MQTQLRRIEAQEGQPVKDQVRKVLVYAAVVEIVKNSNRPIVDWMINVLADIYQVEIQVLLCAWGSVKVTKYTPRQNVQIEPQEPEEQQVPRKEEESIPEEQNVRPAAEAPIPENEEQGDGIHHVRPHVLRDKEKIKKTCTVQMPDGTVKEVYWSVLLESAVYHPQGAQSDTVWENDLMARCVHTLTHADSQAPGATGPDVKLQHVQNALLFVFRKILRECGATMIHLNHLLDYDGRYWGYVMGNAKRVWYAVVDMFWAAILRLQHTLCARTTDLHVKFSMPGGIHNLQLDYHYYERILTPDWSRQIRKEWRENITRFLQGYRADLMQYCKGAYTSHAEDSGSVGTYVQAPPGPLHLTHFQDPPGLYHFYFREYEVFQTLEFDSSIERNILPVILDAHYDEYWLGLKAFCAKMNADRQPLTEEMNLKHGVKNHNFKPIERYHPNSAFRQQEYRHRGICAFVSLIQCYADEPESPSQEDLSDTEAKLKKEEINTWDGTLHKAPAGWRDLQKTMNKKPHGSFFAGTGAPMTSFESIEPGAGFSRYSIVP